MPTPDPPIIVQKLGIDVTPHAHGIWSAVGDGDPFVNEVALRKWSDDGRHIWLMLDSHNFKKVRPDELVDVVELPRRPYVSDESQARYDREAAAFAGLRPDGAPNNQGTGTDVY